MAKSVDELYAEADEQYQNTITVPNFTPPVGEGYTVSLDGVVEMVSSSKKTKEDQLVVCLTGMIEDGPYANRRTTLLRSYPNTRGFLKSAVELIVGESVGLKADIEALKAVYGTLLSCDVTESDDGKYKNWRIQDVVGEPDESEPPTTSEEAAVA